jgi:hypothetical protein
MERNEILAPNLKIARVRNPGELFLRLHAPEHLPQERLDARPEARLRALVIACHVEDADAVGLKPRRHLAGQRLVRLKANDQIRLAKGPASRERANATRAFRAAEPERCVGCSHVGQRARWVLWRLELMSAVLRGESRPWPGFGQEPFGHCPTCGNARCTGSAPAGLVAPRLATGDDAIEHGGNSDPLDVGRWWRASGLQHVRPGSTPVHVVTGMDEALPLLKAERDENTCRKSFVPEEAAHLAEGLEKLLKPLAKERQVEAGRTHGRGMDPIACVNFTQAIGEKTRDKIGEAVGMSWLQLEKAREVVKAAEAEPEKFAPLVEEMNRTGRVNGAHRKLRSLFKAFRAATAAIKR